MGSHRITKMKHSEPLNSGYRSRRFHWQSLLLCVALVGCNTESNVEKPESPADTPSPIQVVVIEDEPLADAIRREWQAQSQDPITVKSLSRLPTDSNTMRQTDVVIFPTRYLGQFVEQKQIMPLPESVTDRQTTAASSYDWDDILPLNRREEMRWAGTLYAVSFGSPRFLVIYRSDLLEQWNLTPPTTWTEYQETLQAIRTHISEESEVKFATAEPLAEDWAARTFLARTAAYARHANQYSTLFDFTSMEPLINTAPYVRALKELQEAYSEMTPYSLTMTPHQVAESVCKGESVMGIAWPCPSDMTMPQNAAIGFARIPGSEQVYRNSEERWETKPEVRRHVPLLAVDGRLGAISRAAGNLEAAANLLLWLTSKDQSARISTHGYHTTLFRESQRKNPAPWVPTELAAAAQQYADVVNEEQDSTQWLMMPRIPGQDRYLAILDDAVRTAVLGNQKDPQQILDQVAESWSQITKDLGVDNQKKAYAQDLGID